MPFLHNILPVVLVAAFQLAGFSQTSNFNFHHLKESDGLSHNMVNSFFKDSRSIMWLGTVNGLDRYDGNHFYSFKRTRKGNSIIDDAIVDLCEDKNGRIWGATGNGIFCYNPTTNFFKNYTTPSTRFAKVIHNIGCDSNGTIWATGEWNIMTYDPVKDAFTDMPSLAPVKDSMHYYAVRPNGMLADPLGRGMWFATRTGLHLYDNTLGSYIDFKNRPGDSLFNTHSISALSATASGKFIAFDNTTKDVLSFNPKTMKLTGRIPLQKKLPGAFGYTLFEDNDARIWLGIWNSGIYVIDTKNNNNTEQLKNNPANAFSIAGEFMWDAMQDADGTIWLGTTGGISRCNPSKTLFKIHEFSAQEPALKNFAITIITENPADKSWWIVYQNGIIARYLTTSNQIELIDPEKGNANKSGFKPGGIYSLIFQKDTVFICTTNGTWLIGPSRKEIKPYSPLPGFADTFIIKNVVRYNDSITYVSNLVKLVKINTRAGTTERVKPDIDTLDNGQTPVFEHVTKGPDGKIWFITGFGWIGSADINNKVRFIKMLDDSKLDYNGYFNSIAFDNRGTIWLANRGAGVSSYNIASGKVRNYYQSDGMISDNVHQALPDGNGKIWCSSINKFSIIEPGKGTISNFSLPIGEVASGYDNYSSLTTNGHVITSVNKFLVEFYPERTYYMPVPLKPEISIISINGKDSLLYGNEVIRLEPDENSLTLKFGMLTDRDVFPYFFEYQLKGIDDVLKVATASDEAVYNDLPPGNYVFSVRATASDRHWNSVERILKINIRTPFYKSVWFWILMGLIITIAVVMIYRHRIKQQQQMFNLKSKAELLEKEKAVVMYESLKQHLNPHFLFNSLTSLGSLIRFDQNMAGDFLDKMSKVYRYILKNRDNETVPLGEELKAIEMYIQLQKTRFENGLQVNMNISEEYHHRKVPPVTLQNLVENAIKHNTTGPDAPLVIEIFIDDDYLVVRNNLQRKGFVESSNKQGLSNMASLFQYMSNRPMQILENDTHFTVKIPLL